MIFKNWQRIGVFSNDLHITVAVDSITGHWGNAMPSHRRIAGRGLEVLVRSREQINVNLRK